MRSRRPRPRDPAERFGTVVHARVWIALLESAPASPDDVRARHAGRSRPSPPWPAGSRRRRHRSPPSPSSGASPACYRLQHHFPVWSSWQIPPSLEQRSNQILQTRGCQGRFEILYVSLRKVLHSPPWCPPRGRLGSVRSSGGVARVLPVQHSNSVRRLPPGLPRPRRPGDLIYGDQPRFFTPPLSAASPNAHCSEFSSDS